MKKVILIGVLAVLCIALAIGGTVAFSGGEGTAVNVVTMGNLRIDATQTPSFNNMKVIPGREYASTLNIKNTGAQAAYIRVLAEKVIELAQGVPDPEKIVLKLDTVNWTYKDGYYYYNRALEPGKSTEPLFTAVTFDVAAGNEYQGSTAHLDLTVFATQVKNNGTDVFTAAGWPENVK